MYWVSIDKRLNVENDMDWNSIDWNKLRKEIMREEETKMDDIKVTVCPHEHETDTYKVVYEVGERSDYIPTGMYTALGAIGYAICYLENEIHEQEVSDHMPNYYMFTTDELYTVMYKLTSMEINYSE
jgi:hypothetical protein